MYTAFLNFPGILDSEDELWVLRLLTPFYFPVKLENERYESAYVSYFFYVWVVIKHSY